MDGRLGRATNESWAHARLALVSSVEPGPYTVSPPPGPTI